MKRNVGSAGMGPLRGRSGWKWPYLAILGLMGLARAPSAESFGAPFIYQGELTDSGVPANGLYDFVFVLYDGAEGANPIGPPAARNDVPSAAGVFVVELDFGVNLLSSGPLYMEIAVRRGSETGSYVTLAPRQPVGPRLEAWEYPFALYDSGVGVSNAAAASAVLAAPAALKAAGAGSVVESSGTGAFSVIGGGLNNTAAGDFSSVNGGQDNAADGAYSSIAGGINNVASGANSTATGGRFNTASGDQATVGGGRWNLASFPDATVAGGRGNSAMQWSAFVGGGEFNAAKARAATVGGGDNNVACGEEAVIAGGSFNTASSLASTIGGGRYNVSKADLSTVGGGRWNNASGSDSTIGGGACNTSCSPWATVGGGYKNEANGDYAMVPGGCMNKAYGRYSFAAGRRAQAFHNGAFVWADNTDADLTSSRNGQFLVRAAGGVRFFSNANATMGVELLPGAGTWSTVSDRASKDNIAPVNGREVLDRVATLPIETWNYKAQGPSVRHMGPMAQDWHAAFGLGASDKTIDTVDPDGVSLAAIQGLYDLVKEKDAQIRALEARLQAVEQCVKTAPAR